jgi:hypothetical protein
MALLDDILAALERVKVWKALQTAPDRLAALEKRVAALEGGNRPTIRMRAPVCPVCGIGSLRTVTIVPDPVLGPLGPQQHTLRCVNPACGHTETRQVPGTRT